MRKNKATQGKGVRWRKGTNKRTVVIGVFLAIWLCGITARLGQLMFASDARVERFSENQKQGSINRHLPRGVIYDRNLNELAVSIEMNSLYANPGKIENVSQTSQTIASILEPTDSRKRTKLAKKIVSSIKRKKEKHFVWVRRKIEPAAYEKISNASLVGVGFVKESKRFYPKRDIAAKIIGFCGIDNQGLYGIEYHYDKTIRPKSSRFTVLKDALGRPISMPEAVTIFEKSSPYDLILTIDERIQYIAEKALEKQVHKFKAKGGVVVVMNPYTGEVIAIAEHPRYNPNDFANYSPEWWKSKAVANAVEPGSTFKLFVAAVALENKTTFVGETIDCENGRYKVGGRYFGEAHNYKHELLTVSEIISKSSNIGTIKLAEKLGPERLYKGLKKFGFGEKMRIDMPGENAGLLRPPSEWSLWSLPSISFGQEVSLTPIQLAAGISVFANGGKLLRPQVVKSMARNGKIVKTFQPEVIRKVISEETASAITKMMIEVVLDGTGKRAAPDGFTVAGKTGTAQKIDPSTKRYSPDKYLSSFAGFFPAKNPKLTIVVMIDEAEGDAWGGVVAGPVFREIAEKSARVMRMPSSLTKVYEINWGEMVNGMTNEKEETPPSFADVKDEKEGSA